ncbi:hypothetical protein JB92DRAFT_2881377 [Gautieria morchelliformis]|nr:hypothetical protein JB92DRAFT_2881377 [Gautieria morchelliformis]
MDAQLQELLPFLHDRNPQVRQVALESLVGHTPADAAHRGIFLAGMGNGGGLRSEGTTDTELARDLKLLCRDQLATAHDAFRALVNLSDTPPWARTLSEPSFLAFLVSYILHPPSVLADLAAMLLSNLTAHRGACAAVQSMKIPVVRDASLSCGFYPVQSRSGTSPIGSSCSPQGDTVDLPALPLLIDAFASSAKVESDNVAAIATRKGQLHFLSSVFANLSATPLGRLYFLTPSSANTLSATIDTQTSNTEYPISKLIAFTEYADTIRRGGVASVIKNCAFHARAHRALLTSDDTQVTVPPSATSAPGVNILPAILLPLAGPEEFELEDQEKLPAALQFLPATKRREPDSALRLMHVETLLLLCTTRWGRDYLRRHGTYEIVRAMHAEEHVDKISEHVERLVILLKGDEGEDDSLDLALSEDERIEEV